MIAHVDEGVLQALLDQELDPDTDRRTREHLATCPACRERFADTREANNVLASALSVLDPAPDAPDRRPLDPPPSTRARRRRRVLSSPARAAAMLVVFAAAASATIPGSPLRRWIFGPEERIASVRATSAPPANAPATAAPPVQAGVSVEPVDGRFEVFLVRADPALRVRARIVDDRQGAVYVAADTPGPRFGTAPGTIRVSDPGPGELRVDIPRTADSVAVVVDGRTYLVKDAEQLRLVPSDDSAPAEVLFIVGDR